MWHLRSFCGAGRAVLKAGWCCLSIQQMNPDCCVQAGGSPQIFPGWVRTQLLKRKKKNNAKPKHCVNPVPGYNGKDSPNPSEFCRVSLGVRTVSLLQGFLNPCTAPWECLGVIPVKLELRSSWLKDPQQTRIADEQEAECGTSPWLEGAAPHPDQ